MHPLLLSTQVMQLILLISLLRLDCSMPEQDAVHDGNGDGSPNATTNTLTETPTPPTPQTPFRRRAQCPMEPTGPIWN